MAVCKGRAFFERSERQRLDDTLAVCSAAWSRKAKPTKKRKQKSTGPDMSSGALSCLDARHLLLQLSTCLRPCLRSTVTDGWENHGTSGLQANLLSCSVRAATPKLSSDAR